MSKLSNIPIIGNLVNKHGHNGNYAPSASCPQKIIGYYPAWKCYSNYEPKDIPVEKLTHINYAFANIENGEVVLGDKWADVEKPYGNEGPNCQIKGNFNQLLNPTGFIRQRNPLLKVLISIGGWTWSKSFSDIAATEASRERFAVSCATFTNKYGFDGVDIDWEFPVKGGLEGNIHRPEDADNYILLLYAIRKHLEILGGMNGRKYLLTIASPATPFNYDCLKLRELSEPLDWINIMNYDYAGPWSEMTLPQANLYPAKPLDNSGGVPPTHTSVDQCVKDFIDRGVPPMKIVVGIPFYGRGFANVDQSTINGLYSRFNGPLQGKGQEPGNFQYSEIREFYLNPESGYIRYWNSDTCSPHLYNPSTRSVIVYDDPWSMFYKGTFVTSKNLGGAMIWELSGDFHEELLNSLCSSIRSGHAYS